MPRFRENLRKGGSEGATAEAGKTMNNFSQSKVSGLIGSKGSKRTEWADRFAHIEEATTIAKMEENGSALLRHAGLRPEVAI